MNFSVLYENGFIERKKSPKHFFFRVLGDGIFQRIVFYNEHQFHYPIIDFSVCSLYGVLDKALFETQTFAYPQFEVARLSTAKSSWSFFEKYDFQFDKEIANNKVLEEQEEILYKKCIPLLNSIDSQQKLIEGFKKIDFEIPLTVLIEPELLPVYLYLNDWLHADMICSYIVEQNGFNSGIDFSSIPAQERELYYPFITQFRSWEKRKFEDFSPHWQGVIKNNIARLEHVRARDEEWRKAYLAENYARNMEICKKKHFVK